jgi:quercetin dioxygenase-like cupin family protein
MDGAHRGPVKLLDFSTVTPRQVAPGYLGRYVHSDQITQGRVDIQPGAVIPDHSHPHEQWTLLLSGSFELTVAGVPYVLKPGQMLYIAPHERHSARALTASVVLDVFHPPRDDYR